RHVERFCLLSVGSSFLRVSCRQVEIARQAFGHTERNAKDRKSTLVSVLERERTDLVEVAAHRVEVVAESLVCQGPVHPREHLERERMFDLDLDLDRDTARDDLRPLWPAALKRNRRCLCERRRKK